MSSKQTSQITKKYHIWFHWSLNNIQFLTKTCPSIVTTSFLSSVPPKPLLKKKFRAAPRFCAFFYSRVWTQLNVVGRVPSVLVWCSTMSFIKINSSKKSSVQSHYPLLCSDSSNIKDPIVMNQGTNQPTNQPSQAIANEHWPTIHPTEISRGKLVRSKNIIFLIILGVHPPWKPLLDSI